MADWIALAAVCPSPQIEASRITWAISSIRAFQAFFWASICLRPPVGKVFPLAEATAAHRLLEENTLHKSGSLAGKILLTP